LTNFSVPYLSEIIDFFAKELKIRCFKLNLIKDNPVMRDKGLCLNEDQIAKSQKTVLRKLVELNRQGYEITELNVQEKLMNLLVRAKSNICTSRGCMGGTKMIAFDRDGLIYPCDITDYRDEAIGSVHEPEDLVYLIDRAKHTKDFFNKKQSDKCNVCPFHFFCKGGCTTAIKYKLGKVEGIDRQECIANKSLYNELINIILTDPYIITPLTRGKVKINL
jgi:radical SAM protein with 4Fe4S-binding SPASM domain